MLTDEFKESRTKSVVVPQNVDAVAGINNARSSCYILQDKGVTGHKDQNSSNGRKKNNGVTNSIPYRISYQIRYREETLKPFPLKGFLYRKKISYFKALRESTISVMPALRLLGRKWLAASDDLVFPSIFELLFRFVCKTDNVQQNMISSNLLDDIQKLYVTLFLHADTLHNVVKSIRLNINTTLSLSLSSK
ncbi:hypothetical protein EVAR_79624_1 [Eumeta japonica]|uniref:Uncharacterized protein n=1 Tax=Eumeta variegata TaxID=151549 RepID=A0A4C1UF83_EUMVA|nr:hypothetical protein EVAR_79624_1 [Eumeta japonica]